MLGCSLSPAAGALHGRLRSGPATSAVTVYYLRAIMSRVTNRIVR